MQQNKIMRALLLFCLLFGIQNRSLAQTTLAAGDILFTSYNGVGVSGATPDTITFVLLTPISANTVIYLTDRGYQGGPWQGSGTTEGTISWTSGTALAVGQEVEIAGLGGSAARVNGTPNGTVATVLGGNVTTGLSLSNAGDQIIAFQGGAGDPTSGSAVMISGLSWALSCGTTTITGWNGAGCTYGPQSSIMPPGLTGGVNAFLAGAEGGPTNNDQGKFNCTGTPYSTVSSLKSAIMSLSNWVFGGATNTTVINIPGGCNYYSTCTAPTITANPPNRAICVSGNTTFSASASGATAYQWQVNTGSGFTDITNGGVYSNATTSILTITGATAGMTGYLYRLVAMSGSVSCATTSTAGTLTVSSINTSSASQTNVACNGGSSGSASVSPTGGLGPYFYSWSPSGGTGSTASLLTAGSYTVTVTDIIGCTATRNFTVTQPTALNGSTTVTNVACNGGTTGAIDLTPSGGTPGYTYNWGGVTTQDRTSLAAGTYSVIITDANACTKTITGITLTQPTAVSGSTVVTNVACNGGTTGAINLTPSGGTGPYTFSWTSGPTTEDRTSLAAGSYSVTITDANSCTGTVNATVTQPTAVSGTTVVTNVACFSGNTGAINLTPTGGTGPYTFNWTSGPTTEDRTSLTAGTYSVTITDANTCTGTVNVTVTQPSSPVSGTTVVTNVACFGGNTGAINLTPTGGTGPYTFSWTSGPTTEDRTSLIAGTYTVTITDANSCTGTVSATVTQPAAIVSGTTVVTNVACNGGTNGAINLTPAGGTGPYTFNWGGITTEDRTGLTAGTYSVIITDNNGCTGTVNATVTQPTAISITASSQTNVACNGGSNGAAAINAANGGTPGYTYDWTPGTPTGDGTTSISGLTAGTYTVTVTDANTCQASVSFTITQPTPVSITASSQTNVACNGGSNGAVAINAANGGTPGYTYDWTPGTPTGDGTTSISGLTAGTYTVTVTDANACQASVSFTVTEPTPLSLTAASQTNVSCNGGSNGAVVVNAANGGTPGYTYDWTPGTPTGDGTTSISGLIAGSYTVTVTDANACQTSVSFTVTEPTPVSITADSQTNISCNGEANGAASINTATGGTPGYTYDWTPGTPTGDGTTSISGLTAGTYTVTATDANGCSASQSFTITEPTAISFTAASQTNVACFGGNTGAFSVNTAVGGTGTFTYDWAPGTPTGDGTTSVSELTAGTYTVTATDANACFATVTFTITEPTALVATADSQTDVSCNGGSNGDATVGVTGGTPSYTYSWSPSGGTAATATGLAAGTYVVTVTDANACEATQSFTIAEPTALVATAAAQTDVSCNGGSNGDATVDVTGGTPLYTYSWSPSGGTAATATGLAAGTYTVTVTDANNCQTTQSFTITEPTTLVATAAAQTDVSCNGAANGTATVDVTGGTSSYTYSWSPSGGTAATATDLDAGTYTVTVTDANNCQTTQSFTITEPTALVATADSQTDVLCNGNATGSATVDVTGGTPTYTYSWAPTGGTAPTATDLAAGTYTVTVTDANGCTTTQSFTITEPTALVATAASQTDVSCHDGSDGSATVDVTGGVPNYTYSWSPSGGNASTETDLIAGTYTVTVTDDNGCTTTQSFTITEPAVLSSTTTIVACGSYTWTDGVTYTTSGTQTQNLISSVTGCDSVAILSLTINTIPTAGISQINDVTLQASGTGTYQWINCADNTPVAGATAATFVATQNGSYAVVVSNGSCSDTSSCITVDNVGLNELSTVSFSIAPNPTHDLFRVIMTGATNAQLTIIDNQGKIVQTVENVTSETQISLGNVDPGMYHVRISTVSGTHTERIIKQ